MKKYKQTMMKKKPTDNKAKKMISTIMKKNKQRIMQKKKGSGQ